MENVCTKFEKDPKRIAHVRVLTVVRPLIKQPKSYRGPLWQCKLIFFAHNRWFSPITGHVRVLTVVRRPPLRPPACGTTIPRSPFGLQGKKQCAKIMLQYNTLYCPILLVWTTPWSRKDDLLGLYHENMWSLQTGFTVDIFLAVYANSPVCPCEVKEIGAFPSLHWGT